MATKTPNLGLNTWIETDPVNFEEMNYNFETIDKLVHCVESGFITAPYTNGSNTIADWYYRKYSDGMVEICADLTFTKLMCDQGSAAPYYSADHSEITLPFTFVRVYDLQMHTASNSLSWVTNITGGNVTNRVIFRRFSMSVESSELYKQVFVRIVGKV